MFVTIEQNYLRENILHIYKDDKTSNKNEHQKIVFLDKFKSIIRKNLRENTKDFVKD